MIHRILPILLAGTMNASCGSPNERHADGDDVVRIRMPDALQELSGLAVMDSSHLLTVTDELATVYSVNLESGAVEALFSLGNPAIRDDFEGITIAGNDVWLITSRGLVYRAIDGLSGGKGIDFEMSSIGLEDTCEIEGLSYEASRFLIACKKNYLSKDKDDLLIYSWSPGDRQAAVHLALPISALVSTRNLNPSDLSVTQDRIHVVAARQKVLLLLDRKGNLLMSRALKGHRQAEGIAVMPDGAIWIADEGKGKGNGGVLTRLEQPTDTD